jgi:hypothetical protein
MELEAKIPVFAASADQVQPTSAYADESARRGESARVTTGTQDFVSRTRQRQGHQQTQKDKHQSAASSP